MFSNIETFYINVKSHAEKYLDSSLFWYRAMNFVEELSIAAENCSLIDLGVKRIVANVDKDISCPLFLLPWY